MNDEDFEIQIKGKIDLSKVDARDSGLIEGGGEGEMEMIVKAQGQPIMRVRVHKLSFEGTKAVTDPNKYPSSSEK